MPNATCTKLLASWRVIISLQNVNPCFQLRKIPQALSMTAYVIVWLKISSVRCSQMKYSLQLQLQTLSFKSHMLSGL